jgi:hypothetical protein
MLLYEKSSIRKMQHRLTTTRSVSDVCIKNTSSTVLAYAYNTLLVFVSTVP